MNMALNEYVTDYYANNAKKLRKMVDNILKRLKFEVDNSDFYSIANEVFVQALRDFDVEMEDFDGFLYSCLVKKFKTEMTRRNRLKRQADKFSISIDTPIGEDGISTLADIISDEHDVESELFAEHYSTKMNTYLDRLSKLQKEVLVLISMGFEPSEIINELQINKKQYDDCYSAIHSVRNTMVLI